MLIIIGLLLFVYWIEQTSWRHTKKAAWLIFLAATFVMGWRSVTYTPDNIAYAEFFGMNVKYTLAESWKFVLDGQTKDPFYHFLGNVFSKWGFSYRGWFVFIASVYMGGFCYLMYKRSCNFFLSFFLMVALGYYFFAMTALRQALALGFCYFGFEFICQKKPLFFAACVVVGSFFHSSALIFLLMYPISFIPFGWKWLPAVISAPLIAMIFPKFLGYMIEWIAWNDDLERYSMITEGLTISGYVIEGALLYFCIWCRERQKKLSGNNESPSLATTDAYTLLCCLDAIALGVIFRAFSININNFFRIALYFSCYVSIAIPLALKQMPERERRTVTFILIAVFFIRAFYGGHYDNFSLFEELP